MDGIGKIARQIGNYGQYADVQVSFVSANDSQAEISATVQNELRWAQDWADAARYGVSLGLKLARVSGRCIVTRVHGVVSDTSPGIIMMASILAVWNATSFVPGQMLANAVENCIVHGHDLTPQAIASELLGLRQNAEPGAAPDANSGRR